MFLVRHAKAGRRNDDRPDDHERPLSSAGHDQAEALVKQLVLAGAVGPLVSSPFLRCLQTLQPLATLLDADILDDDRLAEEQPVAPMLELMDDLPDAAVLCSHGDMIPAVIEALERRGCSIVTEPNWKKASVWVLSRDEVGRFAEAAAWPPPVVGRR